MALLKSYNIAQELPTGINSLMLKDEIIASNSVTGFATELIDGDNLEIHGIALSNESALDAVISAHVGTKKDIVPGTMLIPLSGALVTGPASSGYIILDNEVLYQVLGVGTSLTKTVYYACVVPQDYCYRPKLSIDTYKSDVLTAFSISAYINGVIDTVIADASIMPSVNDVWEQKTYSFGSKLKQGDLISIQLNFNCPSGLFGRIKKIHINYNV
jgi:hypothetical protein